MPNYDPIEQEIINALTALPKIAVKYNYDDTDWTNAVKAIFGAIGHKRNSQSWSGFRGRNNHYPSDQIRQHIQQALGLHVPKYLYEWLYDILWWDQDNQGYLADIPLVAESEWGKIETVGGVKEDFQRLLLARSKYRVMIFQCTDNEYPGIIQWFKEQVKRFIYTKTSDRYLFCSYMWQQQNFRFELYVSP